MNPRWLYFIIPASIGLVLVLGYLLDWVYLIVPASIGVALVLGYFLLLLLVWWGTRGIIY